MNLVEADEYVKSSKEALAWFVECMGEDEWHKRRKSVIDYFNSVDNFKELKPGKNLKIKKSEENNPIAMYSDWMAWYMYLIDSWIDRPACDDPMQSARIGPFFATIGREIDLVKKIGGIEGRIEDLLDKKNNQPDSTFFEIVVALAYCRNGWEVQFIPETSAGKTPDFEIRRGGDRYFVECKRLAKVNDYTNREREDWFKKWKHLLGAMRDKMIPMHAEVIFQKPIESLPDDVVQKAFSEYLEKGAVNSDDFILTNDIEIKVNIIDFQKISEHFKNNYVRFNSPQFIALLAGEYDPHGNYTHAYSPSEVSKMGEDDGLHILNTFIGGLHTAYSAKWECVAEDSIDKKAKDIKKMISKASSQIPDEEKGIIHVGYETVSGHSVELKRYEKIRSTLDKFDFKPKEIKSVFCHALQTRVTLEEHDFAETAMYWGSIDTDPTNLLEGIFLLCAPGTNTAAGMHWLEDHLNQENG